MAIIIDLIIVAVLALSIFLGYKKGLAKNIIKIISFLIAIVIAILFFKPVSDFIIEKTEIDETIKSAIVDIVKDDIEENGEVKEDANLSQSIVNYINDSVKNAVSETKDAIVESAADGIATTTINIGTAIILFIATTIILLIVSLVSDFVTDLPGIKQFDKTGGVIFGFLRAAIIILIVFSIISLISPLIEQTGIVATINKSFIGSLIYNNNILLNVVFNK